MVRDYAFAEPLAAAQRPRARPGIVLERVFEQRSAFGDFLVTYLETSADEDPPVVSELVGEWLDPAITKHRQGLGFVFPVRPGQTAALREFCDQAFHRRRFEHHVSRRALGLTRERIYLNTSPQGDLATFYLEGEHPRGSYERFAASQAVHDAWFKAECREIFPEGCDLDQPLPLIEIVWDHEPGPIPA